MGEPGWNNSSVISRDLEEESAMLTAQFETRSA